VTTPGILFPNWDPVAFTIGPIAIRWYALAYIAGILLGQFYMKRYAAAKKLPLTSKDIDDAMAWIILGVLVGGRLGHVIFYQPQYYFQHPIEIFQIWQGGMSFHGGILGLLLALYIFSKRRHLSFLRLVDLTFLAAPIGIFFGRLANFVNGELYGRVTDRSWGIIFPKGGPLPRHPSQLYEAATEGLLLFCILAYCAFQKPFYQTPGRLSGLGLVGYSLFRCGSEFYRQPEPLDTLWLGWMTQGQIFSLPLLALGLYLLCRTPSRT